MLIESLLQNTLGVKSFFVKKVTKSGNILDAWMVHRKRSRPICAKCKRKSPGYDTLASRTWRYVPMWGFQVILHYSPRRVKCKRCGITVEYIPWTIGKSPISIQLVVYVSLLARILSWKEVARIIGVHWNTVRAAVKKAVEYGLLNRDISGVVYIGVDEISRRKGHTYQTNVYDLEQKRLLWTGKDRKAETLQRFFEEWGEEGCKRLSVICCDMWDPYIKVIRKYAPHTILVFDKFHIIQHLNKAVDKVRIEEAREKKESDPDLLKGTRYIWLKNPENLTDKQKARLSYLEKVNLKTNRAYILKDHFSQFWKYQYSGWAEKYLDWWCSKAMRSRLEPLKEFVRMVRRYKESILTYFRYRVTNAASEGLNRKAKVLSAKAYGYRTSETYSLALYHVLGGLPLPEITHRFL